MKKLTFIIGLFISVSAFSQPPTPPPSIPDSIVFINQKHISEAIKKIDEVIQANKDKLTLGESQSIFEGVNMLRLTLINIATEEYNKKQKPIKVIDRTK